MQQPTPAHTPFPKQARPESQKNETWKKNSVRALAEQARRQFNNTQNEIEEYYKYYKGEVLHRDYKHITEPYGKERKGFPAKLRYYNIIQSNINLLLGERASQPFDPMVTVLNEDSIDQKMQKKFETMKDVITDNFIKKLQEKGVVGGQEPPKGDRDPERESEKFEEEYKDYRSIRGQKALNYITHNQEVKDKIQKLSYHFTVGGLAVSYRYPNHNEVQYQILDPTQVAFDKSNDLEFIEDGQWVAYRSYKTLNHVIDDWYNELSQKQVYKLQEDVQKPDNPQPTSAGNRPVSTSGAHIEEIKVFWKSLKRIGFLDYTDEFNLSQKIMIDEDYEPGEGETVEWMWISEVWEGVLLNDSVFVNMGAMDYQRRKMDNPSECKLPINGRTYLTLEDKPISLVSLAIPFQIDYNIYWYRLQNTIAKSRDVIAQIDINSIPDRQDWDIDKFLYYMDALGIAFTDYNKEGAQANPQHQSVIDLTVKTIEQMLSLLEFIKGELQEIMGINGPRRGEISPYQGTGANNQAISKSTHMTMELFRKLDRMIARDMQALVDYSKIAWEGGKKVSYIMPDGTQEFLQIDGNEHMETEYGVFYNRYSDDKEKMDLMKQMVQPMIQNGLSMSKVAQVIDSDNFTELKQQLEEADKSLEELRQAQRKADLREKQQETKANLEETKLKEQAENERTDKQIAADLTETEMESETELAKEGMVEAREVEQTRDEHQQKQEELAQKEASEQRQDAREREKLSREEKQKQQENRLKEKEARVKEKEADAKKQQAQQQPKQSSNNQ